jgi:DNA ligase 4
LSKEDAMRAWDPSGWMLKTYKVRASLLDAANAFEMQPNDENSTVVPQPQIGTPIEVQTKTQLGRKLHST